MSSSFPSPTPPATGGVPISVRGRTSRGPSSVSRDSSAKTMVTDQISQAVLSTSNLLHIMLQSSPSQDKLVKLPKNLLAKASTIKNTQQVLEQMPLVISSLDAHMDHGLQRIERWRENKQEIFSPSTIPTNLSLILSTHFEEMTILLGG
ncbi:unnamed protein product [Lactuca virosa]|uniref:BLOC-1-related complex subunit 7 n=1 Tax=Lactuca virosa TaxID=75947 RepID=A0AAU9PT32_9ASTR|nr:unnamed protein product [Lactuca virosa]